MALITKVRTRTQLSPMKHWFKEKIKKTARTREHGIMQYLTSRQKQLREILYPKAMGSCFYTTNLDAILETNYIH